MGTLPPIPPKPPAHVDTVDYTASKAELVIVGLAFAAMILGLIGTAVYLILSGGGGC